MLFVSLNRYGDFDMLQTDSVWYSEYFDNLSQTGLTADMFENDENVNKAKAALKGLGFKTVKLSDITVGGNL